MAKEGVMTWDVLTASVSAMDEQTAKAWINYENSTHKRASYLKRLHQRYCKVRDQRERNEILQGNLL